MTKKEAVRKSIIILGFESNASIMGFDADILDRVIYLSLAFYAESKCKEQRIICANEIPTEDKKDALIYAQTEAIRNLVIISPLPEFDFK